MQQTKTDNTGSQGVPCLLDNTQPVVADAHPPQSLQPADGPLHHPTDLPQPAAVGRLPPADVRLDAQPGQQPPAAERRPTAAGWRSEEHTSELQSHVNLVCRLLLEKKKKTH